MTKILVLIVGAVILGFTIRAWIRSIKSIMAVKRKFTPTEIFLEYPLLFAWLLFATVFSVGMMVNN